MNILSCVVVLVVSWWLILFIILPIGIKDEDDAVKIAGQDQGAPANSYLLRKILLTTLLSIIITFIIHLLIAKGIINLASYFKEI